MSLLTSWLLVPFLALSSSSFAAEKSPYAADANRTIKALSAEEIEGYKAGKGMGFAKAAELNGYPGPMHVLELAEKLSLSADQKKKTQAIFEAMKIRSMTIGQKLVTKEGELNELFASGKMDETTLKRVITEIGELNGEYRRSHLQAHLEQKKILNGKQIELYSDIRGYSKGGGHDHKGMHHPH